MEEKTLMRPVLITAGILGIIQGLTWTVLSGVSILYYFNVIKVAFTDDPLGSIGATVYEIYLNSNSTIENILLKELKTPTISNKTFNIFMYFYFGFSLVWLASSAVVLWGNLTNKMKQYMFQLLCLWIMTVALLSILDLILTCLIASDYDYFAKQEKIVETGGSPIILASMGIVMTLAARGYIVLVINVIFATILAKYCHKLLTKNAGPENSIIDAYGNNTRPPWDLHNPSLYDDTNAANFEFINKGFRNDNQEPVFAEDLHPDPAPMNRGGFAGNPQRDPRQRDPRMEPVHIRDPRSPNNRMSERAPDPSAEVNYNYPPTPSNINNFRNSPMNRYSYDQPPMDWRAPQIKTAKIGRPAGTRSPQQYVNPPYIPAPDYSPSNSLRVKGVLRPKSNYMYQ